MMRFSGLRIAGAVALVAGLFTFGGLPGSAAQAFTYDYKSAQKIYRGNGHYSYRNQFDYNKHGKAKHYGHKKHYGHSQQHNRKHAKRYGYKKSYGHSQQHRRKHRKHFGLKHQHYGHHAQKPQYGYSHVAPKPAFKRYDNQVVVHGQVGRIVGKHLTPYDSVQVNQTLETVRTGDSRSWYNDKTGKVFTVSLLKTYQNSYAHDCRDYRFHVKHHGRSKSIIGSACRLDNGSWKLVS